jgi:hypothetical protein
MARTGLRMMPTSPSSPLRFRTAGFPRYGSKAGLSDGAYPPGTPVKPAPGIPGPSCGLHSPFVPSVASGESRSVSGRWLGWTPPCEWFPPLYPRGPRSGPGYVVPIHHRLLGPIRPTRRHVAPSRPRRLYATPSLCGSAEATREWFRAFAARSFPACRPLRPRSARRLHTPSSFADDVGLRRGAFSSALSYFPPSASRRGVVFGASWFASVQDLRYGLLVCSPPWRIGPGTSPSLRGLFCPRFRRVGHPSHRQIWLRRQLGKLRRRDSHPPERQLASLHCPEQATYQLTTASVALAVRGVKAVASLLSSRLVRSSE